ncbi:PpiC-type peptidyl-prolyl cis-trans isomerase [Hyphomicrobium denitrificans ATCC 51888]|uniref:Parvulin-like PPIase n=1 Tax=Hyphomicrobium denitrificans (strain ATCC 51888 / DSM 1869 / NCIMB 11706 / TK 0415) TaxID=582899 RepID=D8JW99_HYPDA|nr:peptidylprolyl isomerase [Hyphomicrobium denitrificans]ADJ24978.1 PpiC-type peptidyl-prolyl cis-trans isomerase [Hyphomicrobium denitrificans ATCC 51888]
MKRIFPTAFTVAFAVALLGAPGIQAFAQDKVVATIDGKPITEGDLAVAESEIGSDMGTMPGPQKRTSLLEFLIDNQLFAEAGEKAKLDQGPDFETRLAYLKRRALRELYFEKVIKGSVSDADARKIYDDQVKLLKPEEEVSARHILVETEEQAKELKAKLDKGADFAQLAKENSKDPGSKDDGGNLGYFGHGQMVPQFEEVVFKLKKGEVSAPVKTQFGWHLVKLEDSRTKQPPAFEIVKDRIAQSLLLQKAQKTATELRANAKIEIVDPEIKKSIDERNAMIAKQAAPSAAPSTAPAAPPADAPKDAPKP